MAVLESRILFDDVADTRFAHHDPRFDRVLHVFDHDWHGIRSAGGCLPGHKLTITHQRMLEGIELRYVFGHLRDRAIRHVVFQGYSEVAARLAALLRKEFGRGLELWAVTHVTASQFEHLFEIRMLRLIQDQICSGVLNGTASVKPDFEVVFPPCRPGALINLWPKAEAAPLSSTPAVQAADEWAEVFIPVENTFRKNLYANFIAAHGCEAVARVLTVNEPSLLEELAPLTKLIQLPFQTRDGMLEVARRVDVVLNVTFAECQPMTQLEALAVGTPCLTGVLGLPELDEMELSRLCVVGAVDNPRRIRERLEEVLHMRRNRPETLRRYVLEYREAVRRRAIESYLDLLQV